MPLAPCASKEMLVDGVFKAFKNDEEFRLVMFALGPLYSESYDANKALEKNLETVFRARTHSMFLFIHLHVRDTSNLILCWK